MASLGFCEAPRVVAAKIDRDRQEPRKLFDTFLLVSSLADLLENILATPAIVDMLILLVKYDFFSSQVFTKVFTENEFLRSLHREGGKRLGCVVKCS